MSNAMKPYNNSSRGVVVYSVTRTNEWLFDRPFYDDVKFRQHNIEYFDLDNFSETYVVDSAIKFIENVEEAYLIIQEVNNPTDYKHLVSFLAKLSRGKKRPFITIYKGSQLEILRFRSFLNMYCPPTYQTIQDSLMQWINERQNYPHQDEMGDDSCRS